MRLKRVLFFSLLFSLLIGALLYYWLPRVFFRHRIDSVPAGAYIVPWTQPSPSIEELNLNSQLPGEPPPFDIDLVMSKALKLSMTFNIEVPEGNRIVPSTVYLGHDSDYLYIGGEFIGMYTNPASDPLVEIVPNYLEMLLDVNNDGILGMPESGSRLSVFITPEGYWMWGYHDIVWAYSSSVKRMSWYLAENWYENSNRAPPGVALGQVAIEYDNSTGTLTMLFSRFLSYAANREVNALQMRSGEIWVMGFVLELGYATHISALGDYVADWPQQVYPYLSNDSSWWPKLAIDLSSPPEGF